MHGNEGNAAKERRPHVIAFALALGLFSVLVLAGIRTRYREMTESSLAGRTAIARLAAAYLGEKLGRLSDVAVSMATRKRLTELAAAGQWEAIEPIIRGVPGTIPHIERVFLADPTGVLRVDSPVLPGVRGKSFAERDWYRRVSKDWRPSISAVYQRAAEPRYNVIAAAAPIRAEHGRVVGILVAQVRLDTLIDWGRRFDLGPGGVIFFVDQKGRIAGHPSVPPHDEIPDFSGTPLGAKLLRGENGVEIAPDPLSGEPQVAVYAATPEHGWGVVIQQPERLAFASRRSAMLQIVLVRVILLALTWFLAYRLLRVFTALQEAQDELHRSHNDLEVRVARRTAELAASQEFLRQVIDVNPNLIFAKDRDGRFVLANRAVADVYGTTVEGLVGKTDADFNPNRQETERFLQDDRTVMDSRVEKVIPEEIITDASGNRHWLSTVKRPLLDADGKARRVLGVATDITAVKRLEQQLGQSQKMEAVGRLAGGVAHDFNNLLTAISGYCYFLLNSVKPGDALRADIEEITKAADRAAALTRQLLAFSRQQVLQPKVIDLNSVVRELERMLQRIIGEPISLASKLAARGRVKADPGQIEQVVMNLVVNARDAMPAGGMITIETADIELNADYARTHPEVRPGPHVMLAVSDNGTGMDEKTLARLFEPFFTTKEQGKGTGLGLSTVYGIVKQSSGGVYVYSEVGRGSTFKVFLPRVDEPSTQPAAAAVPEQSHHGDETVLLVEDDEAVRRFASRLLSENGYRVLEARLPADALALAEREKDIRLLLTDLVMPGMRGDELARQLVERRPDLQVIFTSGYTESGIVRHDMLEAGAVFIQKPIDAALLLRRARELLGRGPAAR